MYIFIYIYIYIYVCIYIYIYIYSGKCPLVANVRCVPWSPPQGLVRGEESEEGRGGVSPAPPIPSWIGPFSLVKMQSKSTSEPQNTVKMQSKSTYRPFDLILAQLTLMLPSSWLNLPSCCPQVGSTWPHLAFKLAQLSSTWPHLALKLAQHGLILPSSWPDMLQDSCNMVQLGLKTSSLRCQKCDTYCIFCICPFSSPLRK